MRPASVGLAEDFRGSVNRRRRDKDFEPDGVFFCPGIPMPDKPATEDQKRALKKLRIVFSIIAIVYFVYWIVN